MPTDVVGIEVVRLDIGGKPGIVVRRFGYRTKSVILNVGALPVYLGNTGVTPSAAYRLAPGEDVELIATDELWGCVAAVGGVVIPVDSTPAVVHVITESWTPEVWQ